MIQLKPIEAPRTLGCPGDKISYNCSFFSDEQNPELTWRMTVPGSSRIEVTYNTTSSVNTEMSHERNFRSFVSNYRGDLNYMESIMLFTVIRGVEQSGVLECQGDNLQNSTILSVLNFGQYKPVFKKYIECPE